MKYAVCVIYDRSIVTLNLLLLPKHDKNRALFCQKSNIEEIFPIPMKELI